MSPHTFCRVVSLVVVVLASACTEPRTYDEGEDRSPSDAEVGMRVQALGPESAPTLACEWTGASDATRGYDLVYTTPIVADLGLDGDPTRVSPSIVVTTFQDAAPRGAGRTGVLRVLDGATCVEQLRIGGPDDPEAARNRPAYGTQLAVGDLDPPSENATLEIVGLHRVGTRQWETDRIELIAYEIDVREPSTPRLRRRWTGRNCNDGSTVQLGTNESNNGPGLFDLDDDGVPEIVYERMVFDAAGCLLNPPARFSAYLGRDPRGHGLMTTVADVDGDGRPELVAHDGVFTWNPTRRRWEGRESVDARPGHVGVADFGAYAPAGADPERFPEIAVVSAGDPTRYDAWSTTAELRLQTVAGDVVFGPMRLFHVPGHPTRAQRATGHGGPPTIVDLDGDGHPEIVVAGHGWLTAYDPDCTSSGAPPTERAGGRCVRGARPEGTSSWPAGVLWAVPTVDESSGTAASAFDFDGDGTVEIVHRDECALRIVSGESGAIEHTLPAQSGTGMDLPTIADVDGDRSAEIVVARGGARQGRCPSSVAPSRGVMVLRGKTQPWKPARPIWNQHAYSVTNVTDEGRIPRSSEMARNWVTPGRNDFHAQGSCSLCPRSIDDGDACTVDVCDPASGAVTHEPAVVDDGNVCTSDTCDPASGAIAHTPVVVDDGDACTVDACDPIAGVSHVPVAVDDGDACTVDACDPIAGVTHAPVVVDDGNACTADACDPIAGVSHTPIAVDDGVSCTSDTCDPVRGVVHTLLPDGTPVPGSTGACATGLVGPCADGAPQCIDGAERCVPRTTPEEERCDGVDNDCDAQLDEGVTRACSTACGVGVEACVPIAADVCSSAVIVSADEWPLSNTGFNANPDGRRFVTNVARCFAGLGRSGRFLARSTNFGVADSGLRDLMASEGHTYIVDASAPWDLATLATYDGVFLAGASVPDLEILQQYVRGGGHVYIAAGTGWGGAAAEAATWNPFLSEYGLAFEPTYAGAGAITITGTHPLFAGVASIYQNNENPIRLLAGAPTGTQIVQTYAGQTGRGYFAVFDDPARSWSACSAPAPTLETCDGVDNDCNGQVDDASDGGPLTRPCTNGCGNEGTETCASICEVPTDRANDLVASATHTLSAAPGSSSPVLSTLQSAYYDRGRDEVAVFSFSGAGRILDRAGNVLREVVAPLTGSLDGAAYDVVTSRALFVNQGCVLSEAASDTLTELTRHSDLASRYGMSICAGLEVGRDNHLYVVSYGTNELVVLSRDTRTLVRRINLAALGFTGCDGITNVPGSGNFLLVSSTADNYMTITPEGAIVTTPTSNGQRPLEGGALPGGWDGILSICSTGHVWVCEEYGTRCVDYAPVDGDQNTCGCLDSDLPADAGWHGCDADICCGAGTSACNGSCVDLSRDPVSCGACGTACGAGEACVGGRCGCPAGQASCGGACIDITADEANCGGCGVTCASDEFCNLGACDALCDFGTPCGAFCVDTTSDPTNCGGCGVACGAGEVCSGAACVSACPTGTTVCGAFCVSTATDEANCGGCGVACASDEFCNLGACDALCDFGTPCGAFCVDTTSDPTNCGGCGVACGAGEVCSGAACVSACPTGTTVCGAFCVNTAADEANCGGCGVACAASEACVSGTCVSSCVAGELECGGLCVDPQTDALHCGGCGVACDAGEVCQLGSCVTPAACGAGEIVCSGACVDPSDDSRHCGGCNEVCPAAQVCGGGECVLATCSGASDPGVPTVSLVGLAPNTEIATARQIVGTASDVDLAAWYLEVAVAGTDDFTLLAEGTSSVSSGALATLDPTLLENGPMTLRLRAVDCGGQVVSTEVPFVVSGENKVGVYAIELVDLEVPLAGLPIRITRRYDTRRRAIEGDFGMGWTLDVGVQGRVGRNVPIGRGWNFPAGGFLGLFPCDGGSNETESHFVEVRLSEQERYRFRPVLVNVALLGSNLCEANVRFEQIDGRPGAELVVVGNDYVIEDGFSGNVVDGVSPSTAPFDPTTFQLVTREGWRYQISRDEGVEAVWSPTGDTLSVSDAGIAHSAGVGIPFVRNAEGLITEIVDPAGNRIRYGYEGRELASVVDRASNPATRFFYLPGHYLDRIEDPTGATPVRVEYDSDGRMRRSFDESGNPELVDWDPTLNVGTFTSRGGAPSRAVYDTQGRLIELQVGTYFPTRFEYDAEGRRTREDRVDPVTGVPQTTRRWEYDAQGELTRLVDEGGIETRTTSTYGSNGRLTRREVRTGTGPTRVTLYDSAGRITQYGTGPNRVTMTYDAAGRVVTEQRGVGPIATLAYDARGNVVSITTGTQVQTATYDANNWLRSVTSDGTTLEYDYDANGRRTEVRANGVLQEELLYDARGVTVGRTRPGEQLDFTFDDATGQQETTLTEARVGGDFLRTVTTMTRDLDDRVATLESRQYVVDASGAILSELGVSSPLETVVRDDAARTERRLHVDGSSELRTFDGLGRLVSRVDEEGRTQTWTYDAAGRVTQMPDGSRIGYDADGRVDVRTDPAGRQTWLTYGTNGRITQLERRDATGAVLGTDVYAYDASGQLTQATDAGGRITRFGLLGSRALGATGPFDTVTPPSVGTPAGRVDEAGYGYSYSYSYSEATRTLTRSLVGQSAVERFVKDELGRVVEHQTFNGDVVRYGYDTAGNRALIDLPATATSAARTYTLSYTPGGDLAQVIDSARGATTYTYDARQRLTEIAYPASTEYPSGSYVRFGRDRSGLVTSRETPSGTTFYGYDAQRRLREVTDTRLGAGSYVYTRDAADFVTRIDLPDGSVVERSPGPDGEVATIGLRSAAGDVVAWFGYVRDAAGRIVGSTETVGGVTYASTFVSDDRGRLIEENRNGVRTLYTYDDADNRVRVDRGGVVESYAYDAVGRLVAAGDRSFSYDANGSVTSELASDGTTRTFTYDALARLVAFEQGSLAATYDYDAEGIRFWASVEDGIDTTIDELLVDPTFAHAQVLEQSSGRSYVFGDDRIAVSEPGGARYLHADARSLRIGATPGAASVDATDYDAFGQTLPSAPRAGGFGFAGEAHDDQSGLVYLRARYYDPSLGRFLSRDSYADQPPYAYVGNDPMNATDPSGHFTVTEKTGTMIGFDTLAAMQAPVAIPGTLQAVLVWHVAAQSPVVVGVGVVTTGATFYLLAAIALDQFTPSALHPNASVAEQLQRAIEKVRQRAASNQVQGLASISAVHVSEGVCEGTHATSDDVYTGTNRGARNNRIRPLLQDNAPELFPMFVNRFNLGAATQPTDRVVQACIAEYNFMTQAGSTGFSQSPWSCSERDVVSQVHDACGMPGLCHMDAMRTEAGDGAGNVCETLPDGSIKPNCCGCCLFWIEMKWNILNRPADDPWGALRDPACTLLDVIDEQLAQNQCAILDNYFNGAAN